MWHVKSCVVHEKLKGESPTFTRLRQTIGEPKRFRQAMKWRAAGDANGVARSTG